jgi:hypothetical protein
VIEYLSKANGGGIVETATPKKSTGKKPVGLNLSEEARRLMVEIAAKRGVSQTGVVEMAIRDMAQKEGVQ